MSLAAKCQGPCAQCGPGCSDPTKCTTLCGQSCVDTKTDASNCGGCNKVCTAPAHANTPTCSAGKCTFTCDAGFGNCNGNASDGCETDFNSDAKHCGTCDTDCTTLTHAADSTCSGGTCSVICDADFGNRNGNVGDGCEDEHGQRRPPLRQLHRRLRRPGDLRQQRLQLQWP